ncbi:ABC transporter permease [Thermococcus barophilus]|uniref:ABC-type dipeptide/oligopeptide transport permease protein n=1 Tax=Thermococcus barophilus TaxID=55802 RepID=A0A0S1X9L8_THEBA|nr:ABC transporter permease [Thermococcus barophilus]ALM74486.1 ABC-type dipeptide/oligopeptide transport permease protein [Thermococcus barophilus]
MAKTYKEALAEAIKSTREILKFMWRHKMGKVGIIIFAFLLIMALFPQLFTKYTPDWTSDQIFVPASWEHPCGLDHQGKDIWTQIVYGARISLSVGFMAALLTIVMGALVGTVAGYYGGIFDDLLMFLSDSIMMLPSLLLLLVIASLFSSVWNIWYTIVVIALISWPSTARMVRAQTLQLKHRLYVEAAVALGASNRRIIFRHILPSIIPLLFARAAVLIAGFIVTVASLTFLGLGDPNNPDWGYVMYTANKNMMIIVMKGMWQWIVVPGIMIALAVIAFVCLGEALEDYLNPKLRER